MSNKIKNEKQETLSTLHGVPFIQQVIIPHTAPKTPCRPRAPKSEFSREMALGTNESLYLLVLTAGNLKRDLEGNN